MSNQLPESVRRLAAGFIQPFEQAIEAAERIEVGVGDAELRLVEFEVGQAGHQAIWFVHAHQLGDVEGLFADELGRGANTADSGVSHQCFQRRWSGHTHMDGQSDAFGA